MRLAERYIAGDECSRADEFAADAGERT